MPLLDLRDILAFPSGDNSSDTIIGNVHFNLTTLDFWNYTLYSNGTLSNGSWCLLTFEPYTPSLVRENGSFANVTWCYSPVKPIGQRAGIGIGFAAVFGLVLVMTLMNLSKHGKTYVPAESRFRPIGRRWQWYWSACVCAMAIISLIINVDVDRYFLPELPLVLNVFFWFLMQMAIMAAVWEMVRHWGSWMERQYIDPNPFCLRIDDRRSQVEFWVPLFFYLCFWVNFFMIVPRNWGNIELQRYPEQIVEDAAPTATDGRFKAAAFCLFLCWLTTIFSLCHSIQHYCDRSQGLFTRAVDTLKSVPLCFQLILPLALVVPLYQAMCAWNFAWSPLNVSGLNVAIFAGGYAPSLLILLINSLSGFRRPNEDKELLRQRRVRGDAIDQELGLVRKPAWWRRLNSEGQPERIRDKIARNVRELGGGKPTARHLGEAVSARAAAADPTTADAAAAADAASGGGVELAILRRFESHHSGLVAPGDFASARQLASKYTGRPDRQLHDRTVQAAASLLFPGEDAAAQAERVRRHAALMSDEASPAPPPYSDATKAEVGAAASRGRERAAGHRPASGGRSSSAGTSNSITAPPQQVRSMLDV